MKSRSFLILFCAVALAFATPALAAWTPNLPGWTVQEFPMAIDHVVSSPDKGIALDPVSGDLFVEGFATATSSDISLFRVTQSGQAQQIASPVPYATPVFDPVHRVVLLPTNSEIQRLDEHGAPLPPIPGAAPGPIAVTLGGELVAVASNAYTASGLQFVRYDEGLFSWIPTANVPPSSSSLFSPGTLPSQLLFDSTGRAFLFYNSTVAFRVDDLETVGLGGSLTMGTAAVGSGLLFLGRFVTDALASGAGAWSNFASPGPDPLGFAGIAVTPDGRVLVVSQGDWVGPCSLVIFSRGATPAVHRSWGAVKALAR